MTAEVVATVAASRRVADHLRAAGKWAAGIAEKIGVAVAAAAIKAAIGA